MSKLLLRMSQSWDNISVDVSSESQSSDSQQGNVCDVCYSSTDDGLHTCKKCKKMCCEYCLAVCPTERRIHKDDWPGHDCVATESCNYKICKVCIKTEEQCKYCETKHCKVKDGMCTLCKKAKCEKCRKHTLLGSVYSCYKSVNHGEYLCDKCQEEINNTCVKCKKYCDGYGEYLNGRMCNGCIKELNTLCTRCKTHKKFNGSNYCEVCLNIVKCTNCNYLKSSNRYIQQLGYCDTCFKIFEKCCVCNRKVVGVSSIIVSKGNCKCGDCVLSKRHK